MSQSKQLLWGNSFNPDYELYTQDEIVKPLIKHLLKYQERVQRPITIWCPFSSDKNIQFSKGTLPKSKFVEVLEQHFNVICSHILTGQDFFEYEPAQWDIIVDNPPFQKKSEFFKRALSFNKPFLLLMTMAVFNDRNPLGLFFDAGKNVEVLKFNQRTKYSKPDGTIEKKITFSSGYIGTGILTRNLIIEDLK